MLLAPLSISTPALQRLPLRLGVFRVGFRTIDPVYLPPFWGSSIRGLLGHALRQVHCVTGVPVCKGCTLRNTCNYSWLFETPLKAPNSRNGAFMNAPHPFVLRVPGPKRAQVLPPKTRFHIGLTLFGRALDHLPALVPALHQMGQIGLSNRRGRFSLESLERGWLPDRAVWVPVALNGHRPQGPSHVSIPPVPPAVWVHLETPLRLRSKKKTVSPKTFSVSTFGTSVLRRYFNLVRGEASAQTGQDLEPLFDAAGSLSATEVHLYWSHWKRFSSRQCRRVEMDGLMGSFHLDGPGLAKLWSYLYLGQWFHGGKGTALGLGRYRLETGAKRQKRRSS